MFKLNIFDLFKRTSKVQGGKRDTRSHRRFALPGAQVGVQLLQKHAFSHSKPNIEYFPLSDMSRGGLRFPASRLFKPESRLDVLLYLPDEDKPLQLHGKVRWFGVYPGISYTYHIGVEFAAFLEKPGAGENALKLYSRLVQLEKKYTLAAPNRAAA